MFTLLASPAMAEGEQIIGTLQTSRSGPLEGVTITVTTPDGDEVASADTDADGRFAIDLPDGPGDYLVSLDPEALPDGVTLREGGAERQVTVTNGRRQPVTFGITDGSLGQGSGNIAILQRGLDGIRFGLLIAITAVGLSLIFGTTGLTNFAHGELVAAGAIIAWYVNVNAGIPLVVATIVAVACGALLGALNELALWRPLRRRGTGLVAMLVVSIGLSLGLRYLYQIIFGGRVRTYLSFQGQSATDYGIVRVTDKDLYSIGVSLVVLVLIALMLQRTKVGKAMRAVADNRDLASASGIDVDRVILFVWMLGGGLAALGGVLYGLSEGVSWDMGFKLLLLMFAGVTLGGLGTAYGALVGSLIVGIFVQLSTLVIPDETKNVGGLLLLIVILVVRPSGILGAREMIR
ncbi:MAG: branched-chain amino acid ABC transporter permease [Geodermatophilaceae bacterium]|nr:branched-chain amino acid ABC transporter permease [Geodermatophilaceae bacterium]